ncbi:MAG: Ldh family oxidoreductase, partial [Dehalococcoidia bacterium]
IDALALQSYAKSVLMAAGAPNANADVVAQHLVGANLMGHDSHGVIRIPWYVRDIKDGSLDPHGEPVVEHDTAASAVIDGRWNFGQVVARFAMETAIAKARGSAIACVTAHNCHHVGRVGAYPAMAAAAGMIGIAAVNNSGAGQLQAPYGGVERRMSPNPISISFPTGGTPFLLDMTTSVVAGGKLDVARNKGQELPVGWVVRPDGTPMRDPDEFRSGILGEGIGAILPLGEIVGWKGYGLAFAIDALCGGLSPAGMSRPNVTRFGNGLFIVVIDVAAFTPLDEFRQRVEGLISHCKSSARAPGVDEILVAGEPEARRAAERRAEGIPLDDNTLRQIAEAAASVGAPAFADAATPPLGSVANRA